MIFTNPNIPGGGGELGLTFAPTNQNQQQAGQGPQPGGTVQDAIRILSLNLPRVTGAAGLAPQGLLAAPGAAGVLGGMGTPQGPGGASNPLLEALRRLLMGGGAPLPSVTPGLTPTPPGAPQAPVPTGPPPMPGGPPTPRSANPSTIPSWLNRGGVTGTGTAPTGPIMPTGPMGGGPIFRR